MSTLPFVSATVSPKAELLGCKVDVIEEPVRKTRFQQEIDKDRVFAFLRNRPAGCKISSRTHDRFNATPLAWIFMPSKKIKRLMLSNGCLERISEASAKLGDLAATLMPDQPWHQIRALGKWLRHGYDAIREDHLWEIIQDDLSPLCKACEEALNQLGKQ